MTTKQHRISPTFTPDVKARIQKLAELKDRDMAYLVRQWALEGLAREELDSDAQAFVDWRYVPMGIGDVNEYMRKDL